MSVILSMLGLTTRRDAEELAAVIGAWHGVYDVERTPCGLRAYYLLEVREPITARTPGALGAAMARGAGKANRPGRVSSW